MSPTPEEPAGDHDQFEPDFDTKEELEAYRNWKPLGDEESGKPNGPAGGRAGKSKKAAPAPTTDINQLETSAAPIIDSTDVLDLVECFYRRFIAYPSEHAVVAHVLWTAHTHLLECFETTPRLAIMSAEKASGKTRLLEVTALFVPNPQLSFGASAAALVRIISKGHEEGLIPTILFDEIDNVFRGGGSRDDGTGDLRAALNEGYRRGATSPRCINHGAGVAHYLCFAPLAVAGLRELPDTLASRSIFIHMRRRAPDEKVESYRLRYHPKEAVPIKEALADWCKQHEASIFEYEPEIPGGIEDRNADIWEPLLTIADFAGSDWPVRARAAAVYLTGAAVDDVMTKGVELLDHIREAFGKDDRLWTGELTKRLCERDESPWAEIFQGKALNDRGLATRLKPYGIKSKQVRIGDSNHKGYYAADFADAWTRYLSPTPADAATAATAATLLVNKDNCVASVAAKQPETEGDGDPFKSLRNRRPT